MTIGIYTLQFNGTDKVYVGKSDNIERRLGEHYRKLRTQKSPVKIQEAYNTYGPPSMRIILECTIPELLEAEEEAIDIWDSINNGFNNLPRQLQNCLGEDSPRANYTNEVYYEILKLLITPHLTCKDIANKLNVTESVVHHISKLEKHSWLKEAYPEEYSKLEHIRKSSGMRRGGLRGVDYPIVYSPDGVAHTLTSPTKFAKEHNLTQSALSQVLNGKRKTHKGWTIKSPDNDLQAQN